MDLKTIRKAVTTHRGGLDGATDGQILMIWNQLDAETQKQYLVPAEKAEPLDTERESDAVTDKPERKVRSVPGKRRTSTED